MPRRGSGEAETPAGFARPLQSEAAEPERVCAQWNGVGDSTRPRIVQRNTAASAVQRRADHVLVAVRLWIAFHEGAAAGDVALRHCHSQPASSQTEKSRSGG